MLLFLLVYIIFIIIDGTAERERERESGFSCDNYEYRGLQSLITEVSGPGYDHAPNMPIFPFILPIITPDMFPKTTQRSRFLIPIDFPIGP